MKESRFVYAVMSFTAGTTLTSAVYINSMLLARAQPAIVYQLDINQDGKNDLVLKTEGGQYKVFLQDNQGNFIRDDSIPRTQILSRLEK